MTLRIVGCVLLIAAGLKLIGSDLRFDHASTLLSHPAVEATIIAGELLLGSWLLFGRPNRTGLYLAMVCFASFAAASVQAAWVGSESCGCLGPVQVHPWYMAAINTTIVLLLGIIGYIRSDIPRPVVGVWSRTGVGAGVLAAGVVVLAYAWYGSINQAKAALTGVTLVVTPQTVDAGDGAADERRTVTVRVTNEATVPVRLIAGMSDCSCVATDDLPLTLQPGEDQSLTIRVRTPAEPGSYTRSVWLVTDTGKRTHLRLTGRSTGHSTP